MRAIFALICWAPVWAWPAASLPPPLSQVMLLQRLPPSAVSVVVMDPNTGKIVIGQNTDTARSPASTVKLITTYAALDQLGPAYSWHTRASMRGTRNGGVLEGDLILQGGGDPYMTLERWWSFAHALRSKGLQAIHGDIVVDNTAFSLPADDAAAFDGKPNRSYNVLPDALMVNFQSIEFTLASNAATGRVEIAASPSPANLTIENHVRFAGGRCSRAAGRVDFEVASGGWDRVAFSGALSPDCAPRTITRVLLKPPTYAFGTFLELWRELGGEFTGKLRIEPSPADALELLNFESLSLGEIVRLTNKYSSNLLARHLLLTMGAERFGNPATPEKGAAAMNEWSRARALDLEDIDIDNGSGLSRSTRISVLQMARTLSAAYRSPYAPEFMASLPLAGIDGTLRSRMKNSPAGAVRLKTGHIDGVSGVAGYVTTSSGKTFVLVSLVNHPRADFGAGEPLHAALVAWILDNL